MVIALSVTDDRQKKALLLNYIGEEAYEIYENLTTGAEDETYEDVITLLDGHFAPKSNISYERCLFRNFKQNSGEKIHQFYIRVKQQALKCDFGDTNSEIKQQLILATNSNKLRRYCFRNPGITLENLLTYARTLEDAESQAEEIEKMSKDVEDVNLTRKSKKQNKADERATEIGKDRYFGRKSSQDSTQKICFRCGASYPHTAQGPAIGKTRNHCHKKNHFERVCRRKYRSNTGHGESLNHLTAFSPISRSESDSDNEVFTIQALLPDVSDSQKVFVEKNDTKEPLVQKTDNNKLITQQTDTDESVLKDNSTALVQTLSIFKRDLALEGISVRFLIDSGSPINIINLETFNQIKKKNRNSFLKPTKTKILTNGAKNVSSFQMKGTCQLTVETGTKITKPT